MQNDFMPQGVIPTPSADQIIPIINRIMPYFDFVIAVLDSHPPDHRSFALNHGMKPGQLISVKGAKQRLYPIHCIQDTWGADLVPFLDREKIHHLIYKGTHAHLDGYSAFFDQGKEEATPLKAYLQEKGIDTLYFCGVGLHKSIKYSILDALSLGFKVFLIQDICKPEASFPKRVSQSLQEMETQGANIIKTTRFLQK